MKNKKYFQVPEGSVEDHVHAWKMGDFNDALVVGEWMTTALDTPIAVPGLQNDYRFRGVALNLDGFVPKRGTINITVLLPDDCLEDLAEDITRRIDELKNNVDIRAVAIGEPPKEK